MRVVFDRIKPPCINACTRACTSSPHDTACRFGILYAVYDKNNVQRYTTRKLRDQSRRQTRRGPATLPAHALPNETNGQRVSVASAAREARRAHLSCPSTNSRVHPNPSRIVRVIVRNVPSSNILGGLRHGRRCPRTVRRTVPEKRNHDQVRPQTGKCTTRLRSVGTCRSSGGSEKWRSELFKAVLRMF